MVQKAPLTKAEALPVQDVASKCENWELDCVQSSYCPEEHIIYKEFTRYENLLSLYLIPNIIWGM